MLGDVLQQVEQHLLDERGVHRHEQDLLRLRDRDGDIGLAIFAKAPDRTADDLLDDLVRFLDHDAFIAKARNGQDVLRQVQQPLRVLVDLLDHAVPLVRERLVFLHGRAQAHDGRQRRADIVRHAAQEIGAHAVPFRLVAQLLLPLDLRRERAHENAHDQHDRKCQRVAVDRHVEFVKRVSKQIVHAHHTDGRRQNAGPVPGCKARDEHHRQNEHGGGKRVVVVIAGRQQLAHADGAAHDENEHDRIAQPLRHALPCFLHKHPSFRTAVSAPLSA